jgi:hypothetical protein
MVLSCLEETDHERGSPADDFRARGRQEYFGLCRNAAYDAAARGEIPVIKIGRLLRVPVRALELMLDRASEPAA